MDSVITKYFAYLISEVFSTNFLSFLPFIIFYTFITHFIDENIELKS